MNRTVSTAARMASILGVGGKQREGHPARAANGAKVPLVDRQDAPHAQAVGRSDDSSVGQPYIEPAVLLDQLSRPRNILGCEGFQRKDPVHDVIQEIQFRRETQLRVKQVVDFAKNRGGYQDLLVLLDNEPAERAVMPVAPVVKTIDRPGIGDQRHRPFLAASRRISRARSETSLSPLEYLPSPRGRGRLRVLVYF